MAFRRVMQICIVCQVEPWPIVLYTTQEILQIYCLSGLMLQIYWLDGVHVDMTWLIMSLECGVYAVITLFWGFQVVYHGCNGQLRGAP